MSSLRNNYQSITNPPCETCDDENGGGGSGGPPGSIEATVWLTGQVTDVAGTDFYDLLINDEGSVPEASETVAVNDDQAVGLTQDHLGPASGVDSVIFAGTRTGRITVSNNNSSAEVRYMLEIYHADPNGNPIDSGLGPAGDLGVAPILTLSTITQDLLGNTKYALDASGVLANDYPIPGTDRIRVHVICEKIGTQGGIKQMTVYFGSDNTSVIIGFITAAFTELRDTFTSYTGRAGQVVVVNGTETGLSSQPLGGGTGDVSGPASSTDNAFAVFDGVTGKALKDQTSFLINGSGNVTGLPTNTADAPIVTLDAANTGQATTGVLSLIAKAGSTLKGLIYKVAADVANRIELGGNAGPSGDKTGIKLGDGTAAPDIDIYRDTATQARVNARFYSEGLISEGEAQYSAPEDMGTLPESFASKEYVDNNIPPLELPSLQTYGAALAASVFNINPGVLICNQIFVGANITVTEISFLVNLANNPGDFEIALAEESAPGSGLFNVIEKGSVNIPNGTQGAVTITLDGPAILTPGAYTIAFLRPQSGGTDAQLIGAFNNAATNFTTFQSTQNSLNTIPASFNRGSNTSQAIWASLT